MSAGRILVLSDERLLSAAECADRLKTSPRGFRAVARESRCLSRAEVAGPRGARLWPLSALVDYIHTEAPRAGVPTTFPRGAS